MGQAGQKRVKSDCMFTIYICFNSGFDQSYVQTQKLSFPIFLDFWLAGVLTGVETSRFMYIWPLKKFQNSRGNRVWKFEKNFFWKSEFAKKIINSKWILEKDSEFAK